MSDQTITVDPSAPMLRQAVTVEGALYQHDCGQPRAFTREPAPSTPCYSCGLAGPSSSWHPLYRAEVRSG